MAPYQELLQVTHRFFYCLDEGRYGELLALMSPEAVWHRQGRILRHVITNAFLDQADDERAELRAYMTAYRFDDPRTFSTPARSGIRATSSRC